MVEQTAVSDLWFARAARMRRAAAALVGHGADMATAQLRRDDGPLALVPCASKTAYRRCEDCRSEAECPIRDTMRKARDSVSRVLDGATLAEAIRRPQYRMDIGAGI